MKMMTTTTRAWVNDVDGDWLEQARCRDVDPELHFGGRDVTVFEREYLRKRAKQICEAARCVQQCLAYVFRLDQKYGMQPGIWGGLSDRQRRKIYRERAAA